MPITRVYVSGLPDGLLRPDSVSVTIEGTSLGSATHVYLTASATWDLGAAVSQSVTSVSSTQIVFDVNLGALSESSRVFVWARIGSGTLVAYTDVIISEPDIHFASGSFVTTTTNDEVITILTEASLGFRPVAVIFFGTGQAGVGMKQSVTFAQIDKLDTVTTATCSAFRSSSVQERVHDDRLYCGNSLGSSYAGALSYVSGELRVTESAGTPAAHRFSWLAIGGRTALADLQNPTVSDGALVTPFSPDVVLTTGVGATNLSSTSIGIFSFGAAGKSGVVTKQWCQSWDAYNAYRRSHFVDNAFTEQFYNGGTTWQASLTSVISNGITWSGSNSDIFSALSLYLDGSEVLVNRIARTSGQTETYTGLDNPDAVICVALQDSTDFSNAIYAAGIATPSSQYGAYGVAEITYSAYLNGTSTSSALVMYDGDGNNDDIGTLNFAANSYFSWAEATSRAFYIGYVSFKAPASASNEATADTIDITATPRSATATASGTASASADRIAATATPRSATATGSGSVNASADRIDSTITVNVATATPSGAATETATSIDASATPRNATATASGVASETATRIDSSATARVATATGSGTAEASALRIAAIATPRNATATPGPASATADRLGGTIAARNAVATPSGTAMATADTIASTATPRNATGSAEGSSETADTLAATATPRAATATATGLASDSGNSIDATITPRVATATATGSASASAIRVSAEATPRTATATSSGSATATASRLGGTATARTAIATASGTASATASRIAAIATARDAVGSAEGSSSTATRIGLDTTARVASATASGTATASATSISSTASPRLATATASGTASDSTGSIDSIATPRDAIATGSGTATASGDRIDSSITVRAATATASGAVSTSATRLGGTATARAAIATPSGAATAIASRVGPLANISGATATPEGAQFETASRIHVGITARSAIAINMGIEPAPYPVELSLESNGIELSIESEGVSLTMPARYHAAVGDLAPKLTMSVGMSLVGHTSLEIRWLLPGEEDVRTGSLVVENAETGEVSRSWLAGDLDAPDNGQVNVEVTGIDPSGRRWTSTTRYFSLRRRI